MHYPVVASTCFVIAVFAAGGPALAQPASTTPQWSWCEVGQADVEGQGWTDTKAPFDRLPARAKGLVREPVWGLARHSSGLCVGFTTDAPRIAVRWRLTSDRLAMPHMAATGVSGVDLYVRRNDHWHYLGTGRPTEHPTNEATLAGGLPRAAAEYRLYFPLYNGVTQVEVGVPPAAEFAIAPPRPFEKSGAVVYGTSITQGGCASRPGMSYSAILGRRLNVPIVNLGFSGNGKAEPEVARLLAELDPAVFVLDPLPNLQAQDVGERLPQFIQILRDRHPETPIVLVESLIYPDAPSVSGKAARVAQSNDVLRRICAQRVAAGDRHILIAPAGDLTVDGGEGTVDSVHPTDLGFVRMADALQPALRAAIDGP